MSIFRPKPYLLLLAVYVLVIYTPIYVTGTDVAKSALTRTVSSEFPNGKFYYIFLSNFSRLHVAIERIRLAIGLTKKTLKDAGFELVFVYNADLKDVEKAIVDPDTSVIVISGHGDDRGSISEDSTQLGSIRKSFRDGVRSPNLRTIVIGTCYSSCVSERLYIPEDKVKVIEFGAQPIGIFWFQKFVTSSRFLLDATSRIVSPTEAARWATLDRQLKEVQTPQELLRWLLAIKNAHWYEPLVDQIHLEKTLRNNIALIQTKLANKKVASTIRKFDLSEDFVNTIMQTSLPAAENASVFLTLLSVSNDPESTLRKYWREFLSLERTISQNMVALNMFELPSRAKKLFSLIAAARTPDEILDLNMLRSHTQDGLEFEDQFTIFFLTRPKAEHFSRAYQLCNNFKCQKQLTSGFFGAVKSREEFESLHSIVASVASPSVRIHLLDEVREQALGFGIEKINFVSPIEVGFYNCIRRFTTQEQYQ